MQKLTLLEMVQDILSSMQCDSVSDVGETQDAEDVVKIIRAEYNALMAKGDWPHLKTATNLTAVADSTRPTLMQVPTDVAEIENVRYNKIRSGETAPNWDEVTYLSPADFMAMIYERSTDNSSVSSYTTSDGQTILYYNDQAPEFFTSFDDNYLVFDSIDTGIDTTLQSSKSIAQVIKTPTWTATNSFVPDLPGRMFPTLLAKSRVVANEIINDRNLKNDADTAKAGLNRLRRKAAVENPVTKRNYGR